VSDDREPQGPEPPEPQDQERPAAAPEGQDPPELEPQSTQQGGSRREPPLVAFGIVIGTAVGGIAGLVVGAFLLGAGIGCAAGVIIGAIAQALHSRG
jgi:hypothetical protein